MRERVELLGGTLLARAGPVGGFELTATIPLARIQVA
jgi:signal transduction histidine kinase